MRFCWQEVRFESILNVYSELQIFMKLTVISGVFFFNDFFYLRFEWFRITLTKTPKKQKMKILFIGKKNIFYVLLQLLK